MSEFIFHDAKSAPEAARQILIDSQKALGFVPNLYAGLAEAPAALDAYQSLSGLYSKTSLNPKEQQVVLLAASVENVCGFCVAAHSMIARNMARLDDKNIEALRAGADLPDPRLNALARFTRALVRERGRVQGKPLADFLAAGFSRAQVLEVVLGVALKTLSNYSNHLFDTPVNPQLQSEAWTAPAG